MKKISKWKINKIAMIMDYVGAVLYFMSLALITGAAINDAFSNDGGNTTSGLAVILYGYAVVAIIIHVIGFMNAKKFQIKRDAYLWGICGNALFLLSAIFSIPATVIVCIAGYKISKMREVEDPYYAKGVDYSEITDKVKARTNDIKEKTSTISKSVSNKVSQIECPKCGKQYLNDMNFCPECGEARPQIIEEKRCTECNTVLTDDSKFCPNCGAKIDD